MPSDKPRIATYTTQTQLKKFKIISAYNNKSMSEYLSQIINETITDFEKINGPINITGGGQAEV